jgi:hypothetical protein
MGGIYDARRSDGLKCHDTHTKFHKIWFSHSNVDEGGIQRHTNSMLIAQAYFYFFKIKMHVVGDIQSF